jgi:hypothetical protein
VVGATSSASKRSLRHNDVDIIDDGTVPSESRRAGKHPVADLPAA